MAAEGPTIELKGVQRRYGDCVAVEEVSVVIAPGELHAIVGENGAGKSTLLKMAAGVVAPSSGWVRVDGKPLSPATPLTALALGVGMVHQHFMLVGAFTALENLVLGVEGGFALDLEAARAKANELAKSTGLTVRLDVLADELTVGERQRLEILRVLFRGARAILLDEPTAVLSPIEADVLYATLARLVEEGRTVAVVTHHLDEVARFASRVTVMRRGRVITERAIERREAQREADLEHELTRAIMGGEPPVVGAPARLASEAKKVLSIRGLTLDDDEGRTLLRGLDLVVSAGEIVGVAGVEGNGQRELVRALAGLEPRARGRVRVGERDLHDLDVRERRRFLAVVHEDRQVDGLVLDATVHDNLVLGDLGDRNEAMTRAVENGGVVQRSWSAIYAMDEAATVARRIDELRVEPKDPERLASELSGGNQQKIVVARALDRLEHPKGIAAGSKETGPRDYAEAVVLAQPTRGVDVGAAALIHRAILAAAARGLAVLIVSADLAELRKLSHRLVVLHQGKLIAELPPDASNDLVGRAMLGAAS